MMTVEHESKSLYKKDTSGRIRQWQATVVDTGDHIEVVTCTGILGGAIKEHRSPAKASATMGPLAVGISRVESAESKKLKDGYFDNEDDAMAYEPNKAMLLHRWDKYSNKMGYPCYCQPKLDGVCAIFVDDYKDPFFKSRENNRFPKLDGMAKRISAYLTRCNGAKRRQVDSHGELYAHGRKVSEIVEAIKGDNDVVFEELAFYTFDYMGSGAADEAYTSRLQRGSKFYQWSNDNKPYVPVRTLIAHNEIEVNLHYENFIREGFEGLVACDPHEVYMYDRRTYGKLKKKNLFSEEFTIVGTDVEEQEGLKMIMFQCKTKDNVQFKVRPAWDHAKRAQAYAEVLGGDITFTGQMATVEYRSITKYGTPFHPVLIAIRNYE